jgi:hypothetical protein
MDSPRLRQVVLGGDFGDLLIVDSAVATAGGGTTAMIGGHARWPREARGSLLSEVQCHQTKSITPWRIPSWSMTVFAR